MKFHTQIKEFGHSIEIFEIVIIVIVNFFQISLWKR